MNYGWWYSPCPLPYGLRRGASQQCFANAFELAKTDTALVYCEGYAIGKSGKMIHHAWVTDGKGSAIDNTFAEPGRAYAGVPFQISFLLTRAIRNHAVICVLDDWEHNWPILGDIGDQPDEMIPKKCKRLADVDFPIAVMSMHSLRGKPIRYGYLNVRRG